MKPIDIILILVVVVILVIAIRREHCVESVTRALDSVDGTWATVSLTGGHAHVRSKSPIDENAYRKVIEKAGYRLVGIE